MDCTTDCDVPDGSEEDEFVGGCVELEIFPDGVNVFCQVYVFASNI